MNGKVESLEMMVEELKRELSEEKAEHSKTMTLLREEAFKNKEKKEAPSPSKVVVAGEMSVIL